MEQGLVSIIIPTFNRAHVIYETLNSIISQSYTNWECIVVDDGSLDGTVSLLSDFIAKDSRIQFYKRPADLPKGANTCRNYGYKIAKGEFVNWFDSDDVMCPNFLEQHVTQLNEDSTLDFSSCLYFQFTDETPSMDSNYKPVKPLIFQSKNYIEDYILHGLYFITNSILWRKNFLDNKDLFDAQMHRAQEWDFHLRMLCYNPQYKYIKTGLFYRRKDGSSITNNYKASLKANHSIFRFFDKAYYIIQQNQPPNTPKLMQYILYRQAVNYYNLSTLVKGFSGRLIIMRQYADQLLGYATNSKVGLKTTLKLCLGVIGLLFFNKGYKLFYYPQYDHRSYTKPV
ncbi:glycosyltransferase family 2 protein [uncultured Winogradskyella sp.]|uniref:glycosyltransferase family 2 protein n=1 Tax=uncultured Winogradskyella sp. TaxID=395353 RepID=UPI00262DA2A7|nr:glycosyltransferase family 2 protein [uncultured Winogradskyella sp.]